MSQKLKSISWVDLRMRAWPRVFVGATFLLAISLAANASPTPTSTVTPTEVIFPYSMTNIHAVADDTVSIYVNEVFVGGQTFDRTPTPVAVTLNNGWNKVEYYVYNGLATAHLRTVPSWSGIGVDLQPAGATPGPGTQDAWLHEYRAGVVQDTSTYIPVPADIQTPTLIGTVSNTSLVATYNFGSPNELHRFSARIFVPTSTPTATQTPTVSPSNSETETASPSPTPSATASITSTITLTDTASFSPTASPTATQSRTPAYLSSPFGRPVIGPVPIKRGQSSCLYFDAPPFASKWEIFNSAGDRVAYLAFGSETHHCWNGISVAPGLYWIVADVFYQDGIRKNFRQKIMVLR